MSKRKAEQTIASRSSAPIINHAHVIEVVASSASFSDTSMPSFTVADCERAAGAAKALFDYLLAPMTTQEFFKNAWEKKPGKFLIKMYKF